MEILIRILMLDEYAIDNEVWQIFAFSGFNLWNKQLIHSGLLATYGDISWVKIGSGNDGQTWLVAFNCERRNAHKLKLVLQYVFANYTARSPNSCCVYMSYVSTNIFLDAGIRQLEYVH